MTKVHRVKMDYKPRERVRPLFYQQKSKQWFKWSLASFGIVAVFQLAYFVQGNKITPPAEEAPVLQEIIALPEPTIVKEEVEPIEPIVKASWKSIEVQPGDSLTVLFKRAGIKAQELQAALNIGEHSKYLKKIFPGQEIKILKDDNGHLLAVEQKIDEFKSLHVERQQDAFISTVHEVPVENRIAYGRAVIKDSLFVDGKRANLEDKLIMELADIFAYDIDFALDIRPDDTFKVLYEEKFAHGEKIGVGAILSAEFTNQGKTYKAVRFTDSDGNASYYTPEGQSLKKAFIRTPVKYTRISSHFNLQRKHPVLHKIRAHKGVDYAAPRGTPIKATGEGRVEFIGRKGGYGNTIILQHGPKYTTLYAHMARFNKKLKKGSKVSQGDVIGYVGSSGLATGPHLHYEFRINDVHRNPLTVALPKAEGIIDHKRKEFFIHAKNLIALMDHHDRVMLAQSELQ